MATVFPRIIKSKNNEIEDIPTTTNYYSENFTLTQLSQALQECKINKTADKDNINMELFRYSSPNFKEIILVF
jgi:hypothetical protein